MIRFVVHPENAEFQGPFFVFDTEAEAKLFVDAVAQIPFATSMKITPSTPVRPLSYEPKYTPNAQIRPNGVWPMEITPLRAPQFVR